MLDVGAVTERLKSLGYEAGEGDMPALAFCVEKARNTVMNETNQKGVPEGLCRIAIDMAAGEFLLSKKAFAPSSLAGLDLGYAVKQVQVGDASTSFAVGEGSLTPEQRLDALIGLLLSYGKGEFAAFRRVKW